MFSSTHYASFQNIPDWRKKMEDGVRLPPHTHTHTHARTHAHTHTTTYLPIPRRSFLTCSPNKYVRVHASAVSQCQLPYSCMFDGVVS